MHFSSGAKCIRLSRAFFVSKFALWFGFEFIVDSVTMKENSMRTKRTHKPQHIGKNGRDREREQNCSN